MSTKHFFNNQEVKIPGAYSTIKSGIKNPALQLAFGNALIIDTGLGASFGGGSGINGVIQNGKDAIYTFDNIRDFQQFVGGGPWFKLAEPLFFPGGGATSGISSLTFVRAATTAVATATYTWVGGGVDGGTFAVNPRTEGLAGNGVENVSSVLTQGYAMTMEAGVVDPAKFIVKLFRGRFTGLDTLISPDGDPIDGTAAVDLTIATLLAQSIEFDNVQEIIDWANGDADFQEHFRLDATTVVAGTGLVDAADLAASTGNTLAVGGTETYASTDLDDALDAMVDLNFDFILANDEGDDAVSTDNLRILSWIIAETKIKPDIYIGGGLDSLKFGQALGSLPSAASLNSQHVTVVHGGVKKTFNNALGFKSYNAIYHAAVVMGREAGLEPQVPTTFKALGIDGSLHSLIDKEINQALDGGVLTSRLEGSTFDVTKGINTLQVNDFLVNPDGTTHSKAVARIVRQLNKELIINSKNTLLKNPAGVNRNTLSSEDVVAFVEGYLKTKTARRADDNIILSFEQVTAVVVGDAFNVTYAVEPNFEVSFIFFTGFLLDPSS